MGAQDFGQVRDGMAGCREGELRLPLDFAVAVSDEQGADVQDSRECGDPGLIVVLRAKETERWIGEVALHQLRGPDFPIMHESGERIRAAVTSMPAKKLTSGRRRPGTRIQQ